MENNKKAHPRTHDESKELVKVREASRVLLGSDSTPVFLIDKYDRMNYDFSELEISIAYNVSELKRSSFILPLQAYSTKILKRKVKVLQSRIWEAVAHVNGSCDNSVVRRVSGLRDRSRVARESVLPETVASR
jgi:hypothetical protein